MNAEIITIGDEILIGQVIDTNSAYLASQLNLLGIPVIQITSVPDIKENILKALDSASERADLIVCTGGLGPTSDDITKPALAEYFGSKLVINPHAVDSIRLLLESRGVELNERNLKQAELPHNCEVLHNSAGTAQGMWFNRNNKVFISLPGVPYEMKAIWQEELAPKLKSTFPLPAIEHITVLTHGVPESVMAGIINDWENSLPENMKLAYLPSPGILRLRITGKTEGSAVELKDKMEEQALKLEQIIGKPVFGRGEDKLEIIVGNILKSNNLTVSTAESCTGGTISAMLTSISGSSAYFKGGIVSYSNDVKTSELSVSPYSLIMNGAVSQQVVEQMADGARTKLNTDFAVAVSGIAGPDGGTEEKPVGTTWIAVASKKRIISNVHNFGEDRGRNIQKAAIAALFMLREEIMNCL
ncbi:MAG TPA: competence/damage-inducible protein A [Bacteroidales bacterium]|nr:competence/damage-inducible protein A [Bacteroidales bacterium]